MKMSDPFSIVVGIIGATATTVHTARRLKEFLDSIKEGPQTVHSISEELGILQCSLTTLEELLRGSNDFTEAVHNAPEARCIGSLETILSNCRHTFDKIYDTIKPFVKQRDRSKLYTWKTMADWMSRKSVLEALKQDLFSAKISLDLGVALATLVSSRVGTSQLQTQFSQLNTRLDQAASEDSMSDVGSTSVVTDLGFALRRYLRETDPAAASSDPFVSSDAAHMDIASEIDDGHRSGLEDLQDADSGSGQSDERLPGAGYSSEAINIQHTMLKDQYGILTPPDSPLVKRDTFRSFETLSTMEIPVASFATPFSHPNEPDISQAEMFRQNSRNDNPSHRPSIQHDETSERRPPEPVSSGIHTHDASWESFHIPLKTFSDHFGLGYKKMMKRTPTSLLNFGIVSAKPISNSPAYIGHRPEDDANTDKHSWSQIYDTKLYRLSTPHWTLKIPSHKAAGKPPTKGVSRVNLSKVVTNGSSYEFIRLLIVAQYPSNNTSYNFQWKPFCAFTYIGPPRRSRDIGVTESASDITRTFADTTPVSAWLAIKDEMLTFRLKSNDDKHFLNPKCAYWSMHPGTSNK